MADLSRDVLSDSERVRKYVETHYIEPAKKRGERGVTVVAGDVHRALRLINRVPLVCTALKLHRFHENNQMVLSDITGPPSKLSTTVQFKFDFVSRDAGKPPIATNPFWQLRGIAKDMFKKVGEWEELIAREREQLSDLQDKIAR